MIQKNVEIKVQPRSGFDKSFRNLLTGKVGSLVPLLVDELIPNTRAVCHQRIAVSLPPLASDVFMNVDYKLEAFAVPHRLLYGGFENFFTDSPITTSTGDSVPSLPIMRFSIGDEGSESLSRSRFIAGSLSDYLGFKLPVSVSQMGTISMDMMPFLVYHRVYDDWYRNPLIQLPVFVHPSADLGMDISTLPYSWFVSAENPFSGISEDNVDELDFHDGVSLLSLRQRNFGFDYFTMATPSPQLGDAASVRFEVSDGEGSFTIAQLRSQNSVQMFRERNNLAGTRLVDVCRARFGAHLSDGVAQRSMLIGSASIPVYSKGIDAQGAPNASQQSTNPFNSIGARYGSAYSSGELYFDFTAEEPCYIIVMGSLVPRVTYSSGVAPILTRHTDGTLASFADPILQNVGPQPIFMKELNANMLAVNPNAVFGYTDRYADWMVKNNELHGLLRDGESLESFALQRTFRAQDIRISSQFLQIPTNFMDQVTAVPAALSQFGYWLDSYNDYKVSQPLATYCLPSLQNPAYEHGNSVTVNRGGTSL